MQTSTSHASTLLIVVTETSIALIKARGRRIHAVLRLVRSKARSDERLKLVIQGFASAHTPEHIVLTADDQVDANLRETVKGALEHLASRVVVIPHLAHLLAAASAQDDT